MWTRLAFVFETPNSADVLVGPLPPGAHDLVLVDGVQEVARAAGAITIQPSTSISIRAVGLLIRLDQELAKRDPRRHSPARSLACLSRRRTWTAGSGSSTRLARRFDNRGAIAHAGSFGGHRPPV